MPAELPCTRARRDEIVAREALRERLIDERFPASRKPNGWTVIERADAAELDRLAPVTNDDRAAVELFDLMTADPEDAPRLFAYIKTRTIDWGPSGHPRPAGRPDLDGYPNGTETPQTVTGFTGSVFGHVLAGAERHRNNLTGAWYWTFRARLVNGRTYSGRYFPASGTYCRLRLLKA